MNSNQKIEALKKSSVTQSSYAQATRQASFVPPDATRQLRSASSGTPPSGTGEGTGRQQNARQTSMTRRTNTDTSVGTSMLRAGRQQAGTMVTSGTKNYVSYRPQQTGEPSTRLISAQQGRHTVDGEGFLTRMATAAYTRFPCRKQAANSSCKRPLPYLRVQLTQGMYCT